jgi:monoamine oxidase
MKFFTCLLAFFILVSSLYSEEKKITVVGAGLAGLTAAYRIEKLTGKSVAVYEARNRPGGRVYTASVANGREELGGTFLSDGGDAVHIKSLIRELGLQIQPYDIDTSGRMYYYQGSGLPYYTLYGLCFAPSEENFARLEELAKTLPNLGAVLDQIFEGNDLLRHLVEIRMSNYEGNNTHDLSTTYIRSFWQAYSDNFKTSETKMASYRMEAVEGGNSSIVFGLEKRLSQKVHYSAPLREINEGANGKLLLTFENGAVEETDLLVLALPCSTLRDVKISAGLFPEDQRIAVETLQYGSNSKIILPVKGDCRPGADFSSTQDGIGWFNRDRSLLTLYFGGKAGLFNHHDPLELSQKVAFEKEALRVLYPDLTFLEGVKGISWIHEEFSKGSYSSFGAGQFDFFNEKVQFQDEEVRKVFRPIQNRIFFAGEHTALDYPATMEGAVESGERTARIISKTIDL